MLIQLILFVLILLIIIKTYSQYKKKEINAIGFSLWLAIWFMATVIVIFPDVTTFFARIVGIKRGADLAIYLSIIFIFYLLFRLLMRIEKIENNITTLVREQALKEKK